jgi:hypothetical protein
VFLIGRRTFLKAGAGLAALLRPLPALGQERTQHRGVIWLWMDGGMSPSHTFDPKPGGRVKAMETSVAGIQISELMKVCATQMKHLSIIRSLSHGLFDHGLASWAMHAGPSNGIQSDVPLIGTILSHELAGQDTPLPPHLILDGLSFPEAPVLGDRVLPFRIQSLQNPIPNIRRNVDAARDRDRAALLIEQNKEWSGLRKQREVARVDDGVLVSERVMDTPLLKAFNYSEESQALRDEYGGGFGESCLLARRLIQAGCGFVEVGLKGWDTRPTTFMASTLDKALGTLIKDLAEVDLLRDTLVVCATPFGRAPQFGQPVQARGFSVVLAGGFLAGGQVYGDTGRNGTDCISPVTIPDLFATIYRACGADEEKVYVRDGRKFKYLAGGRPLEALF